MQQTISHLQVLGLVFGLMLGIANFGQPPFKGSNGPGPKANSIDLPATLEFEPPLQQKALAILQKKCNVCHKKKSPFKVFSLKNMNKHAPKIYQSVFVYRRMPKGSEVKLTEAEYQILKDWLQSENIF